PFVFAASTSLSPAKVPPVTATVALASLRVSGSATVTIGDKVVGGCSSVHDATAAPSDSAGASFTAVMLTVVVAGALRLDGPEPSLATQVTVRVVFEP